MFQARGGGCPFPNRRYPLCLRIKKSSSLFRLLSQLCPRTDPLQGGRDAKTVDADTQVFLFSSVKIRGIFSLSFNITPILILPTPTLTESTNPVLIMPGQPDILSSSVEFLPSENLFYSYTLCICSLFPKAILFYFYFYCSWCCAGWRP